MPSRLKSIRTAIEVHVGTAFTGITIANDPVDLGQIPKNELPHARVTFVEEEPERLDFKQERRRAKGLIEVAVLPTPGTTAEATRETVDLNLESLRDAIFGDPNLTSTVDDASCNGAEVWSGREDPLVYGTIEVTVEEVF